MFHQTDMQIDFILFHHFKVKGTIKIEEYIHIIDKAFLSSSATAHYSFYLKILRISLSQTLPSWCRGQSHR